ncbi:MAG: GNAT family protein [Acidobacteriota bacterium]
MHADDPAATAHVRLRDGATVVLRSICPEDAPLMVVFHGAVSLRSVYQRYFHLTTLEQRVAHARLALTCTVDPAIGHAIVAEHATADGTREVVALGRLTRTEPPGSAEIALLVVDQWHGLGLGTAVMHEVVAAAQRLGLHRLYGDMLADNDAMRAVVRHAGFVIRTVPGDAAVLRAERSLA